MENPYLKNASACPHCGGRDLLFIEYPERSYALHVMCRDCKCHGPAVKYNPREFGMPYNGDRDAAVVAWNRRARSDSDRRHENAVRNIRNDLREALAEMTVQPAPTVMRAIQAFVPRPAPRTPMDLRSRFERAEKIVRARVDEREARLVGRRP